MLNNKPSNILKATAYIALGSNLANPLEQLQSAVEALNALPQTEVTAVSSFYRSKPLGPQDQPDFINAVAAIETALSPLDLLDQLQHIEQRQGRIRLRRWGERTLDLDILLYGDNIINNERLTVPHYDMHNREFVIVPLYEIATLLRLPNGEKLADLADKFKRHNMETIAI
ncbi:2-amino-4-hydroxy-6-hydroxymethyldihydropteridine diphosphokinase [Testudinibacter sp. P80/BLE/0925]|uniref:2-amino-4-hydroxy-6- hydroxymethyldihydropteridine diphosphokinase n=1 Tax=Testudinibacter sp. TW-1 TaxID=3417757 RepID=UPI003D360974